MTADKHTINTKTTPVIDIRGLTKNFGQFKALDKLDLTVRLGEVHGFLGPNGAGKSTTIRVLLGLLKKTGGDATLFGQDPWKQAVELHKRLAYVPGDVNFWPNLTGGEIIDLLGALRGGLDEGRRADLLKKFELDPTKKFRAYSKGNRQKVALVAALASDVELYVLDEPTSGLDPLMEVTFQEEIKQLKAAGKTILLSSHILAEVEALCDHVTIIRQGKAVASNTLEELQKQHSTVMSVHSTERLTGLAKVPGVRDVAQKGQLTEFKVEAGAMQGVVQFLAKFTVLDMTSQPPALEDLFLSHYDAASGKEG